MATIVVTPTARRNLEDLIENLSLPPSTIDRFKAALEPLRQFPEFGAALEGRWARFRFVLGPWRWMLILYEYDPSRDQVTIVTIRDARSARSPRS